MRIEYWCVRFADYQDGKYTFDMNSVEGRYHTLFEAENHWDHAASYGSMGLTCREEDSVWVTQLVTYDGPGDDVFVFKMCVDENGPLASAGTGE